MGFTKAPSTPAVTEVIPVVTETTEQDTVNSYEQSSANRKGLLSTILSARRDQEAQAEGNTTLG